MKNASKKPVPRNEEGTRAFLVRVTQSEEADLQRAAKRFGLGTSVFTRAVALMFARGAVVMKAEASPADVWCGRCDKMHAEPVCRDVTEKR